MSKIDLETFGIEIVSPTTNYKTSSLYPLEPIGIGEAYVESLTCYINRLAIKHSISVKNLFSNFITEKLANSSKKTKNHNIASLLSNSYSFNGTTGMSSELIDIIELLTGRNDIAYLSLRNWQNIISGLELFRKIKSYCPLCYEEDLLKYEVYDRLLWCFKLVEICPKHNIRLMYRCIYEDCNKKSAILGFSSNIGFCSHCHRWLGTKKLDSIEKDNVQYLQEQHWIIRRISEIIIESTKVNSIITSQNYIEGLRKIKSNYSDSSFSKANQLLDVCHSTLVNWCAGRSFPSFENLILICSKLNILILPLLKNGELIESEETMAFQILFKDKKIKRIKHKHDYEKINEQLKYYANNNEVLHLSVNGIAKDLKIQPPKLSSRFPDLCKEIDRKRREYIHLESAKKLESLVKKVKEAVLIIHQRGEYPSARRVSKYFSDSNIFNINEVYDVWVETLVELGLRDKQNKD